MKEIINSIAMATYNGEKYIKEQIDSILENMDICDELIISDDGSTDNTIEIIKNYQKKDKRIKLFKGPGRGVKQNFMNAIEHTSGKYIFLSDQDDVWDKNKIKIIDKIFEENNYNVVVHNAIIVDKNLKPYKKDFFKFRHSGTGILKNIYKNRYIGCCMAFKRELIEKIIPIPNNIEMHDQWIGILGERYGKNIFINEKLIKYRRHEDNLSRMTHNPVKIMIKNRVNLIKELKKEKRRHK